MDLGLGIRTLLPVMDCRVEQTALRACCSSETWVSRTATLCVNAATSGLSLLFPEIADDGIVEEIMLLGSFCWNVMAAGLPTVSEAVSGSGIVMEDRDKVPASVAC